MNNLTKILTFAGVIPFALALGLDVFQVRLGDLRGVHVFHTYSAIILSFMAGTLWGQSSHFVSSQQNRLLVLTNLWAILAWLGLLILIREDTSIMLLVNAIGFWHLYYLEYQSQSASGPKHYYQMRKNVSVIVILLHIVMLATVLFQ